MAVNVSFKERVKNVAISEADLYQKMYVENTYLIFSTNFKNNDYYVLSAEQDNYLHLIGVNTHLSAKEFFERCILRTLKEDDFDFDKPYHDEKSVKGSVRRKINCLPKLKTLFDSSHLLFEENFRKNNIICALATSDQEITVGFTHGKKSRPKTLLKGNELNQSIEVDLILSKKREDLLFDNIIYGNINILKDYLDLFQNLISDTLKNKINIGDETESILNESANTINERLAHEEVFNK
jgi:hypothetical protein